MARRPAWISYAGNGKNNKILRILNEWLGVFHGKTLVLNTKMVSFVFFSTRFILEDLSNSPTSKIESPINETSKRKEQRMLSSCRTRRRTLRNSPLEQRRCLLSITNTTQCDAAEQPPPRYQRPSPDNPYQDEIERLQNELQEPCKTCLYTGVAVCAGLSLYFAKLAIEDGVPLKNQRFLWACSAGWVVAGMYRWQLGWCMSISHC